MVRVFWAVAETSLALTANGVLSTIQSELPEPQKYLEKWPFGLYLGVWAIILPTFGGLGRLTCGFWNYYSMVRIHRNGSFRTLGSALTIPKYTLTLIMGPPANPKGL